MVLLAFASNNAAYGLAVGSFGSIMTVLEQQPGVSRAAASAGLSLMLLTMGLLSPLVGALIQRVQLRWIMATGAALCATGFLLLSRATELSSILALYMLVLGPGAALMGTVPASTLVNNWVVKRIGLAQGLINMPIVMSLIAPIVSILVVRHGIATAFLAVAGVYLALAPMLLLFVRNRPKGAISEPGASMKAVPPLPARQILTSPAFWLLIPTAGAIAGAGIMLTTHIIPYALEQRIRLENAAWLLTIYGLAGIPGSFLYGTLADRFGGRVGLAVNALSQALLWSLLLVPSLSFGMLAALMLGIGISGGGLMGPFLAVVGECFGKGASFGKVVGFAGLVNVIFVFGSAPFAGFLYDLSKGYALPLTLDVILFAGCGVLYAFWAVASRKG